MDEIRLHFRLNQITYNATIHVLCLTPTEILAMQNIVLLSLYIMGYIFTKGGFLLSEQAHSEVFEEKRQPAHDHEK